jgi:hypothetical protein
VAQLLRVGADAMEPQQHNQPRESRIHRSGVGILNVHLAQAPVLGPFGKASYCAGQVFLIVANSASALAAKAAA